MSPLLTPASFDNPDHAHDVDIVMANHLAVVVPCQLKLDSKGGMTEAELVISRKHCKGNRPTRRALWAAAADLVKRRHGGQHRLEVLARLDGVLTPVLRLSA